MSGFSKDELGYVYIIQQVGSNYFKIGYTKESPERRFKELRTGAPEGLKVWAFFHGTKNDEASLHHAFNRFARHGEWFELDIRAMLAVTVDRVLGPGTFPIRVIDKSQLVKTFVKENYLVGKRSPETSADGIGLSELKSQFSDWCRRLDTKKIAEEEFHKQLLATSIGRSRIRDELYFKMVLKTDSVLNQRDF